MQHYLLPFLFTEMKIAFLYFFMLLTVKERADIISLIKKSVYLFILLIHCQRLITNE